MSRQLYQGKILEHYREPLNRGNMEEPDLESEVSNPHCGDELRFTAKVEGEGFVELKFDGEGCALSTASASLLTERLSGQDRGSVTDLEPGEVFRLLGVEKEEVTPIRQKCVLLAKEGIEKLVSEDDET
ncbi:MAG: iron-sulfur cluster assembly scaffold protein [Candidatus Nanohaloarchaea archaeon]|nr:iron-sulfur cluster assembly scaffold protein [Candidatus Nanohaloarchaea archaeon]